MNIQQALCAPFQAAVLKVKLFMWLSKMLILLFTVFYYMFIGMNCMINKEEDGPLAETVKTQVVFLV